MAETFEARKSAHIPAISNFLLSIFENLKYTVAEDGLVVSMPIFHNWKYKYADIESVTRLTSQEAQKLVSEYPGVRSEEDSYEFDKDLMYLIFYCAPGEIEPDYQSPAASVFNTTEDFVLLKTKIRGKPVRMLLSPQDIDGFLAAIGKKLRA